MEKHKKRKLSITNKKSKLAGRTKKTFKGAHGHLKLLSVTNREQKNCQKMVEKWIVFSPNIGRAFQICFAPNPMAVNEWHRVHARSWDTLTAFRVINFTPKDLSNDGLQKETENQHFCCNITRLNHQLSFLSEQKWQFWSIFEGNFNLRTAKSGCQLCATLRETAKIFCFSWRWEVTHTTYAISRNIAL